MNLADLDPIIHAVSAASTVARNAAARRATLADLMKDDRSPVTVADLAVQVAVTSLLGSDQHREPAVDHDRIPWTARSTEARASSRSG